MLTLARALAAVFENVRPLPCAGRLIADALGCVLAEDVEADADSPPFDKALVDGYAVRSGDLASSDKRLLVGETILAGEVPTRALRPREAAVVMTGAPVPPGCDAVIMHERTHVDGDSVIIGEPVVKAELNLLRRGREMRAGELVLSRGTILEPPRLGLLAAVGRTEATVVPRPVVTIVPTGDELVEPGQVPGPGQIRNANAAMLEALAREAGASSIVRPIAPDEPRALRESLAAGLETDVLLITGGVSAGQRDLVPAALAELGVSCVFHKVRLKPGKPVWFGIGPPRRERPAPLVFGLPGNPVSGLVGFLVFVKPSLAILAGRPAPESFGPRARLSAGFAQRGDRTTFYPSRVVDSPRDERPGLLTIETLPWSGSADLRTAAAADGFAIFAAGDRDYAPGELVDFLPMRS